MTELKSKLHTLCLNYVQQRINNAEQAIAEAQQSANNETKSSAGDKYETGRAMMQQETDRNMAQLNEANKLKVVLNHLSTVSNAGGIADAGSIVVTNNGNFYISISAGVLHADGAAYIAVSAASPIGVLLKGKKAGDNFALNGKSYQVEKVY
ncbi:3-oxoacyl-ACP synthase [Mucilaginibacter sp. UR6-1]|uniref:3-oxoacyl-ACP synthase n=1 Tax=Mucilaginibacter sp. UR6-1 TaxID=1435643 RepID=UPI001E626C32|nr:3-oxoacyl-ACP synthase [Mucilaginibacter sp. UR6-1]MCC8409366.1 3-oxoacyl-ACP synthase [Mucilaginibacter sp. UR6-1]